MGWTWDASDPWTVVREATRTSPSAPLLMWLADQGHEETARILLRGPTGRGDGYRQCHQHALALLARHCLEVNEP